MQPRAFRVGQRQQIADPGLRVGLALHFDTVLLDLFLQRAQIRAARNIEPQI